MRVDLGRRGEREHLPIEIQVDAYYPFADRGQTVQAVGTDLRVDDVYPAVNKIRDDLDDVAIGVHIDRMARLMAPSVDRRVAWLHVLAPLGRADGQAGLHAQVVPKVDRLVLDVRQHHLEFAQVVL